MLSLLSAAAQSPQTCGTMEADARLRHKYPQMGSLADFEASLQHWMRNRSLGSRNLVTIPVVVHVIHQGEVVGEGSNLSHEQILSQIAVLNEDFRRAAGSPGFNNHPDGADPEIEFCLATTRPDNSSMLERGVERMSYLERGWQAPPYDKGYLQDSILPQSIWNPDEYLNIWVADLSGNLLGFAQFPANSTLPDMGNSAVAGSDGVVVRYKSFGRIGMLQAPYNQGRTATHEVGHWLGLRHTSGDGDCSKDDFCSDTPLQNGNSTGCAANQFSCGSVDMIENYMDLSDDSCMNIFTNCQKSRMQTTLEFADRRKTLANSTRCSEEVAPAPAFTQSQRIACAGQSITFSDQSAYNPTQWEWIIPGAVPDTAYGANPSILFPQAGTYDLSLTVSNAFGSSTITLPQYISVNGNAPSVFFEEGFENGIPLDWTVVNPDGGNTWEVKDVTASNGGNRAAWIDLYFYGVSDARDELITPVIDLEEQGNVTLTFEHAYRRFAASNRDSLLIYASIDGGASYPDLLYAGWENGSGSFETGPLIGGSFSPQTNDDWCYSGNVGTACQSLDLSAYDGQQNFRLKFVVANDFGNNIYLDNVRLTGSCNILSIDPRAEAFARAWHLYPNPTEDETMLVYKGLGFQDSQLHILDMQGRSLWTARSGFTPDHQIVLPTGDFAAGMYLVRIQAGGLQHTLRLIVR